MIAGGVVASLVWLVGATSARPAPEAQIGIATHLSHWHIAVRETVGFDVVITNRGKGVLRVPASGRDHLAADFVTPTGELSRCTCAYLALTPAEVAGLIELQPGASCVLHASSEGRWRRGIWRIRPTLDAWSEHPIPGLIPINLRCPEQYFLVW